MVGFAKLFEEGDLAKDRHGHPILSQGKLHLDRRSRLLPDSVTVKVVQHELTMIQNCEMRLRIKKCHLFNGYNGVTEGISCFIDCSIGAWKNQG